MYAPEPDPSIYDVETDDEAIQWLMKEAVIQQFSEQYIAIVTAIYSMIRIVVDIQAAMKFAREAAFDAEYQRYSGIEYRLFTANPGQKANYRWS